MWSCRCDRSEELASSRCGGRGMVGREETQGMITDERIFARLPPMRR